MPDPSCRMPFAGYGVKNDACDAMVFVHDQQKSWMKNSRAVLRRRINGNADLWLQYSSLSLLWRVRFFYQGAICL